jgi:hypothetical protein
VKQPIFLPLGQCNHQLSQPVQAAYISHAFSVSFSLKLYFDEQVVPEFQGVQITGVQEVPS